MRKSKFMMVVAAIFLFAAVATGCPSTGDNGGNGGNGYTPPPSKPAEFEVLSLNIPLEPMTGDEVTISVEVENVGELSGNYTAVLKVDNEEVGTKQVNIGGGQSQTVPFSVTLEQPGSYTVAIGSLSQTCPEIDISAGPAIIERQRGIESWDRVHLLPADCYCAVKQLARQIIVRPI